MSEQAVAGTVSTSEVVSRALKPSRGNVLVRAVSTEDTLPGGLIVIPEASRERLASHQMEILAVGEEELCEDEDCDRPHLHRSFLRKIDRHHPIDPRLQPGAWVYVAPRSLVDAGDAVEKRYFVRVDDVVGIFVED